MYKTALRLSRDRCILRRTRDLERGRAKLGRAFCARRRRVSTRCAALPASASISHCQTTTFQPSLFSSDLLRRSRSDWLRTSVASNRWSTKASLRSGNPCGDARISHGRIPRAGSRENGLSGSRCAGWRRCPRSRPRCETPPERSAPPRTAPARCRGRRPQSGCCGPPSAGGRRSSP